MNYEQLEARIGMWARTQPAVRAVIICGSRARGDADRWSDLDAILFTTERERYVADPGWLSALGAPLVTYLEDTDGGDPEWYVVYAGGVKLDVVMLRVEDASPDLDALLPLYPYQGVFARGIRVLFDRLGTPRVIAPKPVPPPASPTAAEFANRVSGFLMAAATTAKFIARGDYWRAQRWFANDLHVHLLALIEWHARASDAERDTWYAGRFIEQWADPRAVAALPQSFALYERDSLQRALWAMLDLFRVLGEETAARLGYAYPIEAHEQIAALVREILDE
ncbi:MAG: aminoglycoside 6-adenylyltransferase [Anaerolineae bacterium]